MKKIFTFCFFAFVMILGTQTATAQSKAEINEKSIATAKKLQQLLNFDSNTLAEVYEAYREYNDKTKTISLTNQVGSDNYNKNTTAVKERLLKMVKSALKSDELYNRYLIATDQPGYKE